VGIDTLDDAGVYKISDDLALVQTVDFFTPIVDDPYDFGQIAAANALSDIYAMGARPLTALNLVGFPTEKLGLAVLARILEGGWDKCKEAEVTLIGGHTIEDTEPKFGLSVTGLVHPDRVVTNAGARPGDFLVLTKPIGTGILTTAAKADQLSYDDLAEAIGNMKTLNNVAAEAMVEVGVNACTDVTGFGLLGHLWEMVTASGVSAELYCDSVPLLRGTLDMWDFAPGGTMANMRYLEGFVDYRGHTRTFAPILCDPETSGGLLISVAETRVSRLLYTLAERGVASASVVGKITRGRVGTISVLEHHAAS